MTWQDLARRIVQANPGARPEIIASAVTQAMPLMNADSQAQWRLVQQQLAEERIQNQRDRLGEEQRYHTGTLAAREEGLRQGEERLKLARERVDNAKDAKAKQLEQNAQKMRQQALQFNEKMDANERSRIAKEWYQAQRAYDSYMRSRISAQANIPNKADRDDALKALDAEYNEFLRAHSAFEHGEIGGGGEEGPPAPAPGARSTPATKPAIPSGLDSGKAMLKRGEGQTFGAPGAGPSFRKMNQESIDRVRAYIQANPDQRDAAIQELTKQGYIVPDGL